MKAGWCDDPLTLWQLAEAIHSTFALTSIFIKYPVLNITKKNNVLLRSNTTLNSITVTTSFFLLSQKEMKLAIIQME